jgi:xylulokinase
MIWMDRRSEPQCHHLSEALDADIIPNTNGGRIDPYYMAPKLLWFREQLPDLYAATYTFLQANGYIVQKLTGCFSMDLSVGPLTMLFDSRRMGWSSVLLEAMELDETSLPPLYPCSQIVGEVTAEAAGKQGLPGTRHSRYVGR